MASTLGKSAAGNDSEDTPLTSNKRANLGEDRDIDKQNVINDILFLIFVRLYLLVEKGCAQGYKVMQGLITNASVEAQAPVTSSRHTNGIVGVIRIT